jgi:hypothetical protein
MMACSPALPRQACRVVSDDSHSRTQKGPLAPARGHIFANTHQTRGPTGRVRSTRVVASRSPATMPRTVLYEAVQILPTQSRRRHTAPARSARSERSNPENYHSSGAPLMAEMRQEVGCPVLGLRSQKTAIYRLSYRGRRSLAAPQHGGAAAGQTSIASASFARSTCAPTYERT